MSKNLVEAPLTTPTARAKLPAGVHWRSIDVEVHLRYRKGVRSGRWLVRWRLMDGRYRQEVIGGADDALPADGVHTHSFHQASARAREFVGSRRADAATSSHWPPLTVRDAIDEYLIEREARELGNKRDARSRLGRYVLKADLAGKDLHGLVELDLIDWRKRLPGTLASTTIRRLVNDFKATLNSALRLHRPRVPSHLSAVVRNGLAFLDRATPNARRSQVLSDDKVCEIIEAAHHVDATRGWNGDLFRLVLLLAASGARFSQVARLMVGDVQNGRLLIPTSRKGRTLKHRQRVAVRVDANVLKALAPWPLVAARTSHCLSGGDGSKLSRQNGSNTVAGHGDQRVS